MARLGENHSYCRMCGAVIKWVKTENGKSMPVDTELHAYRRVAGGKERLVTAAGEVVACEIAAPHEECDGMGYISHFATCRGRKR